MICGNRFDKSNIVIFGGTTGIGLMTAIDFIDNGANVVIIAGRSEWKWERAKNKIRDYYENSIDKDNLIRINNSIIEYVKCDVRLESNVKDLLEYAIKKYQYINVYFNNAGVQPIIGEADGDDITKLNIESHLAADGSIIYRIPATKNANICSTPATDYCENPIATSIIGIFYCLKWEIHYAFSQENTIPVSIINTTSRNGINIPSAKRPIYAGAKAFVHSLTQTIATQTATKGLKMNRSVRVNCIAPGPILTPLEIPIYINKKDVFSDITKEEFNEFDKKGSIGVPLGRTGKTNEISPAVLFLADYNQSSYITGTTITIDGGYTASPII